MEDKAEGAVAYGQQEKEKEEEVVVGANAVAHPRTMVVVNSHTALARGAVTGQRGLFYPALEADIARGTLLQYL